jgi:hypothetical protein
MASPDRQGLPGRERGPSPQRSSPRHLPPTMQIAILSDKAGVCLRRGRPSSQEANHSE